MASKKQGETKQSAALSNIWKDILRLGEELFAMRQGLPFDSPGSALYHAYPDEGVILVQRNLIVSRTAALLQGNAELWLPRWLGMETGYFRPSHPEASQLSQLFPETAPRPLMQAAAQSQQPCRSSTSHSQAGKSNKSGAAIAAAIAAPILALEGRDVVLGVLYLERPDGPPLRKADVDSLQAIASQAALALQTSLHAARDRWRVEQLSLVRQVSSAITSILDTDELLDQVVWLIHERFNYPYVHLFSVHPGRRKIFYEAGSGARSDQMQKQVFAYGLDDELGIIPWVARHGEAVLANDVTLEPRYRPWPLSDVNSRSELTVPLKFGQEVLGVLDIQSEQPGAFYAEDLFLVQALADNIALAMRNANLYRSEKWRRQVADSLREVAGLLSAEASVEHVLHAILSELERNLPCDLAAIWLIEGSTPEDKAPARLSLPALRLAAVSGDRAAWLEPRLGLNLDDLLDENISESDSQYLPDWLFRATQEAIPIIRTPAAFPDALAASLDFPNDYSAIAAPLRVGRVRQQGKVRPEEESNNPEAAQNLAGAEFLGLLTLFHHSTGRYGSEARGMTAAFASYASVAIENTRLFESAHEQVWVSTVLLQVANATQSISDLDELLATIADITPMLTGVKACAIFLLDENLLFNPAAAAGLDSAAMSEFKQARFLASEIPSLEQLLEEKRPVILQRHGEDQRLARLVARPAQPETSLEFLVLVPLLAQNESLGAMLVDYTNDPLKSSVQALEAFFDERLPILQGIAHQAAAAIQNQRLIKAQTEEAYLSVALLQVAQAIVSSSDLSETLGAIVRITPMLVGVKRVAIYLLDDPSGNFRLAQSYGLPRDADLYRYDLDEFPLLQAVIQRDTLAACVLEANPEPEEDEWEDVPDAWTCLPVPEPELIADTLVSEARLLLGFPLSVKGSVFGVMLVEEPNPRPTGAPGLAGSNLRLRSKRLEITTGISQQTAMAIQNDVLQQETRDRERMEREMQLARQIQRTFLPHTIPQLPGWELDVWWRMAREVGGDFYDLLELSGQRLGILIADVADKGMPAALFMTLIRTLVRATVRELDSPAEILARVNDLLVPDAQEGMFVTLFYAVLESSSGCLRYANAGHNPPLWVQNKQNHIEMLTKTSMALGVIEGITVEERMVTLQHDDFVVLYTDGVTDAFSPDGDPYGATRLAEAVRQAAFASPPACSALEMLQAIDNSVAEFVQDAPASDDSTVLILRRTASL